VPATLHTLIVLSAGLSLGMRGGLASMILYLVLGLVGLPVFASGEAGWRFAVGPTGGYLIGFVLAQPILGLARRNERPAVWHVLTAAIAAQGVIFLCGLSWLKLSVDTSWSQVLAIGFWPFVPVDVLLKTVAACGVGVLAGRSRGARRAAGL
ncbi:MAG: biotin transporter BioY, partial [Planctomycetes bacterium]|nr:biotin transporter BioY [Planctomycetota bacterium]